jgi:hypothetical protein
LQKLICQICNKEILFTYSCNEIIVYNQYERSNNYGKNKI